MPPDPIPLHERNTVAHLNHKINGDVQGTLGATRIEQLQGVTLNASGLLPADNGKVLTFKGGKWSPELLATGPGTGQFVEHPTGAGRYLIVAAGRFQDNGNAIGPVYNKLRATRFLSTTPVLFTVRGGGYLLTFGGGTGNPSQTYKQPTDEFTYLVKGTAFSATRPVENTIEYFPSLFSVAEFRTDGILVQTSSTSDEAQVTSFMVEISLYFEPV
jgi:hypothetical protein